MRMCEKSTIFAHKLYEIMAIEFKSEDLQRAHEWIAQAKHIVITTHMAPDGDAMGSALGMFNWLKSTEHRTQSTEHRTQSTEHRPDYTEQISIIVPNAFPKFYQWMPGAEEIKIYETDGKACDALIEEADLFICTDYNDPKRLGPLGEKMLHSSAPKILLDHHLNPTDFADIVFSYPEACSASEIVYRFIKETASLTEYRIQNTDLITKDIATCIYTGLMTDTGNFSFNSTSCDLYEIIAELIRAGIKKDEIYNAVYNQYSTDRVRLTGYALYRKMRIYPEYHLSLITLSADELDQYHYQPGDTEGLVNMPLQISDVYYSVYMREERPKPGTPKPRIRISFRSQGDRPVNIWASEVFNGGGHMNASGGELFGSLNQAVQLFEKTFPQYIKKED